MRIILSPAKKMRREDVLLPQSNPVFRKEAKDVLNALRSHTPGERQDIWNCSAKLAQENEERLKTINLDKGTSPALFSYCGLAYNYLAADALSDGDLDYLQEHLRILSALYGSLRPMDGICSYRLEMEAPLSVNGSKNLYDFWGEKIAREVLKKEMTVINLASKEYSDAVEPHLPKGTRMIHIVFVTEVRGALKTKGTLAKTARGTMVRWLAENRITNEADLTKFSVGCTFLKDRSDADHLVFLQNK